MQRVLFVCTPNSARSQMAEGLLRHFAGQLAEARIHWPFPDPGAVRGSRSQRLEAFRSVRDGIAARLGEWLGELNLSPKG